MNVTEEQWMAYVDGELDAEGRARVEAAMRTDPGLASTVAAQQRLRTRLQHAWAPVLDEPLPGHLRDALRAPDRGRRAPVWLAAAASLVVGVLATAWWQSATPPALQLAGDTLAARGDLADALDRQLTGDPASTGGIEAGLSFRSRDGDYCRGFVLGARSLAGLACHRAGGWQVVALGASRPQGDGLRQAASALPPAVLAEIDARLQGEPLDAAGERRARDTGWR